ncbi:MAG: capsular biosynthesis protein CpsI [Legionellaceae bacterium]|nr:capsular biosynthesis protein CpsI [Legionellaceae bacterium]
MKTLVTGCAGFIGMHLCSALLKQGHQVIGIDNLNDYYDVNLKKARLDALNRASNFAFYPIDITEQSEVSKLFEKEQFDYVAHLAAQPGVRYSIKHPHVYAQANVLGFLNILEGCRHNEVKHLVFASSSSVYGANGHSPFSEHDNVDHPMSFYAATKKANELMAHSYASLYQTPCTGLRFFTVYGPWGRPDMAIFKFTKHILAGEKIDVYNHGKMLRDFTYVDDVVTGVIKVLEKPATPDSNWSSQQPDRASSYAPYRIYNIGNNNPVKLMDFIAAIEKATNKKANINFMEIQAGDMPETYSDTTLLEREFGFKPATNIEDGVKQFVSWYQSYYIDNHQ